MGAPGENRMFYGWANTAILSAVYFVTSGLVVYGYSVIFPAMVEDFGWSRGTASYANSIQYFIAGFMAPVVAIVLKKIGSKRAITLGVASTLVVLLLLGTVTRGIWIWTLLWGIAIPLGLSLCGLVPLQLNVMQWFNVKRTMVIGLVLTAAPVGGFIAQPLFTWLMERSGTWQTGWLVSAAAAGLVLILCLWLRSKPEDVGQFPDGIAPGTNESVGAKPEQAVARTYRSSTQWTIREALQTWTLRLFVVVYFTRIMALMLVLSHGVLHFTDVGYTSMQAAYVSMSILIGSAVIRFPMGWVGDRVEPRLLLMGGLALMLLSFGVIWQAPSFLILMIFGPIFGLAYGTTIVMTAPLVGNYFSPESYPSIMSVVMPITTVCVASVPAVAGFIADHRGNYDLAFIICGIGLAISFIFTFFLAPPRKRLE